MRACCPSRRNVHVFGVQLQDTQSFAVVRPGGGGSGDGVGHGLGNPFDVGDFSEFFAQGEH